MLLELWKPAGQRSPLTGEFSSLPAHIKVFQLPTDCHSVALNADTVQFPVLLAESFFSETTINFGECPLPCFYTSRKRKHIYNVYNTLCFPHQWLVCQFPMLIYKTVSVARAHWTAEGGANMAQAPWMKKTDWLPKLAGFYVIILFRVRQPNFRTTFQRCLPLHRFTKLHIQSTFLLYYAVKIWKLLPLWGYLRTTQILYLWKIPCSFPMYGCQDITWDTGTLSVQINQNSKASVEIWSYPMKKWKEVRRFAGNVKWPMNIWRLKGKRIRLAQYTAP